MPALLGGLMRLDGVLLDPRIGLFGEPAIEFIAQLGLDRRNTRAAGQIIHLVGITF